MRMFPKTAAALLCMLFLAASLSGCSSGEKRIVRIGFCTLIELQKIYKREKIQ